MTREEAKDVFLNRGFIEIEIEGYRGRIFNADKWREACVVISEWLTSLEQELTLDKINKMKSEIADSLEFWDYSPNNNPLARDMLETLTNFLGAIRDEKG